jgi:hypothetical protein
MDSLDSSDEKEGAARVVPEATTTRSDEQCPTDGLRSQQRDAPSSHDWQHPSPSSFRASKENGGYLVPAMNASSSLPMPASAENPSSSSTATTNAIRSYSTFESSTCGSWDSSSSSSLPASAAAAASPSPSSTTISPSSSKNESNGGVGVQARHLTSTDQQSARISTTARRPKEYPPMERIRKQWQGFDMFDESETQGERPCPHAAVVSKRRPISSYSSFARVLLGAIAAATIAAALLLDHRPLPPDPPPPLEDAESLDRKKHRLEWNWDRNVYRPPPNDPESAILQHPNRSPTEGSAVTPSLSLASAERPMLDRRDSQSEGDRRKQHHHRRNRNLLIVQIGISGSRDTELRAEEAQASSISSSSFALWLDISSRPNRAYAKQWGMDYVMIHSPPDLTAPVAPTLSTSDKQGRQQWNWPWHQRREGSQRRRHDERSWWDRWGSAAQPTSTDRSSVHRNRFGLDLISVVQTVLDRQEGSSREKEGSGGTQDDAKQQQRNEVPAVTYDALILIPNNAVVLDLDYDLLRLIPEDMLASLSRKSQSNDKAREDADNIDKVDLMNVDDGDAHADDRPMDLTATVVLFNLQHPHARSVAREWSDLALASRRCDVASELLGSTAHEPAHDGAKGPARKGCVQSGDARLLLQAIESVVGSDGASSLVLNLAESDDDFVGRSDENPHAIKSITLNPAVSVSSAIKSNRTGIPMSGVPPSATMNAVFALQTAADSVCYRYYPKCEVL